MNARTNARTVLIALALAISSIGCPSGQGPVEIVLVNTRDGVEIRTVRLFDSSDPVTDNLIESYVPPFRSRSIAVPFEDTYSADSIGVSFARPGDDVALSFLPDNVEGGFTPGKRIVFVLTAEDAFDVPPG